VQSPELKTVPPKGKNPVPPKGKNPVPPKGKKRVERCSWWELSLQDPVNTDPHQLNRIASGPVLKS
jgi:hypothetical protein